MSILAFIGTVVVFLAANEVLYRFGAREYGQRNPVAGQLMPEYLVQPHSDQDGSSIDDRDRRSPRNAPSGRSGAERQGQLETMWP